jgi:hypothetical protein
MLFVKKFKKKSYFTILLVAMAYLFPTAATGGGLYDERYVCLQTRTMEEANAERIAAERLLQKDFSRVYQKFCLKTDDPGETFAHYLYRHYQRKYRLGIALASAVSPLPLIAASTAIAAIVAAHRRTEREALDTDEGYVDDWKSIRIAGISIIAVVGVAGTIGVLIPCLSITARNRKNMRTSATLQKGRESSFNSSAISLKFSISGLGVTF